MRSIGHLGNWESNLSDGRKSYLGDRGIHLSRSWSLVVLLDGLVLIVHWLGSKHLGDCRSSIDLSRSSIDRSNNLSNRSQSLHNFVTFDRFTTDDGVESVVVISSVIDNAAVTISIDQGVLSLDDISMAFLLLALNISGVIIMHIVRKLVLGRSIGIFDVLHGLHQSRLDSFDQSGLDSLEQRWLLVNYLLWLVLVVFGLMMVLWLLVLLIVLGAGHSDNSEQSDVLKRVNNNETVQSATPLLRISIRCQWLVPGKGQLSI
uniref:Transmembrane protein n=1 Tax=Anopheles melas TaxID=34690 RepID=A0A182U4H1_9DIPT